MRRLPRLFEPRFTNWQTHDIMDMEYGPSWLSGLLLLNMDRSLLPLMADMRNDVFQSRMKAISSQIHAFWMLNSMCTSND